jgi:hypothetical protein
MMVYVLDASVTGDRGDFAGINMVHATLEGAIAALDGWLHSVEIDIDEAHENAQPGNESFFGTDLTVESGPWKGCELSWGINRHTVHGL